MHIDAVPNRGSRPAYLLRESYREDGKVRKRTLANLSSLTDAQIDGIRRVLRGEDLLGLQDVFEVVESRHHGHVDAVLRAMRALRFDSLVGSRRSRERDLVVAMVAARIVQPQSKLATPQAWNTTTLPQSLGLGEVDEDELYAAMDWLLERQPHIEKKLAARHLHHDGVVLYDLTSSYFEGTTCPLAARGHSRDGKKGTLQVNYGLLTNAAGCPVSVSVFKGNTNDSTTLLEQVRKVREAFGVERIAIVGDRGMITQTQVDALKQQDGIDWITALRPEAIRKLALSGTLQMGLFDERNLVELTDPNFPGERLVACRNPDLARLRAHKRRDLLAATVRQLETVRAMVERGRLKGPDQIGLRVGKAIGKYKVAKHFDLEITKNAFSYSINEARVAQEAALDGVYVVRTSLPQKRLPADDVVRGYKQLSGVERAFRSMKTVDLDVRPIHHRLEGRVRAHIFLCMLAYYVQWHISEAWRPLTFGDEQQTAKKLRDPVAPARRSPSALEKAHSKELPDGTRVQSFRTLLRSLSTIVRNTCRRRESNGSMDATFQLDTRPDVQQQKAYDLLKSIKV